MENKSIKKRVISIIAAILALIILIVGIFFILSKCDGEEGGKKKKVVVVVPDDDEENSSQPDDTPSDGKADDTPDIDEYISDDISLSLGYEGGEKQSIDSLLGESDMINLTAFNGGDPLCTNFRGLTGSVYHATEFLDMDPNNRYYTEEMLDLEFSRYKEAGFKYMRTQFKSDWVWSGDESDPWDWESDAMLGFYEFCKKAEEYGIQVMIVFVWYYPAFIEGGGSGQHFVEVPYLMPRALDENGDPIISYQWGYYFEQMDYEEQNRRYAEFGVQLIKALESHGVSNANNLVVFNEPKEDGGTLTGAFVNYQKKTFLALHNALKAAGLRDRVTLYGPNQSSKTGKIGLATAFITDPEYAEIFDVYSSHYNPMGQSSVDDLYQTRYELYSSYMETYGFHDMINVKEFWLDEFTLDGDHYMSEGNDPWVGTQIAGTLLAAINSGVSAISAWQFMDQTWAEYYGSGGEYTYGAQVLGSMRSLYNSETPYPSYYAVTLFSKYAGGENCKTYATEFDEDTGIYLSAVELEDGGWSFIVVNMTTDTHTVNINLEESMGGKTLYRYLYTPNSVVPTADAEIITADKAMQNVEKNIVDTLEGGAVAVYSTIKNLG